MKVKLKSTEMFFQLQSICYCNIFNGYISLLQLCCSYLIRSCFLVKLLQRTKRKMS